MLALPVLPRLLARVLARTSFLSTVIFLLNERVLQPIQPSSLTWYCWIKLSLIVQNSSLLPFLKSLGRFSVPMWLIVLSNQLKIVGLVSLLNYQLPNLTQTRLLTLSKTLFYIKYIYINLFSIFIKNNYSELKGR